MPQNARLGFVGAGNMAEAIARGVLRAGIYGPGELLASDPAGERRALFGELGVGCTADTADLAARSEVVLLAVKPQMIDTALAQIKPALKRDGGGTLVISIVAAITTKYMESALGAGVRVVRVMPNTPMLVGHGMSAVCQGASAEEGDIVTAERIFEAGGRTVRVPETQMDAITALSGSGPAYVFYLAEAMAAAGVKLGLAEADAALLARRTVIGAAQLMDHSKDAPAELRRKVTSPGGTTQAALATLEAGDFAGLMAKALAAAAARGKELSK